MATVFPPLEEAHRYQGRECAFARFGRCLGVWRSIARLAQALGASGVWARHDHTKKHQSTRDRGRDQCPNMHRLHANAKQRESAADPAAPI